MDILTRPVDHETIRVRHDGDICFLQLYRPDAQNAINNRMIAECTRVLEQCESTAKIVVLQGLPEVFCFGADFSEVSQAPGTLIDSDAIYGLWQRLATGPYITIAHVQGKVNAGGVGFVAACDIAICDEAVPFSLSELLFGLIPACVLPFLARRIGAQKAHYMTLMTQPVSAQQAFAWGLVDAVGANTEALLRKHLLRLRYLPKTSVARYKAFSATLDSTLAASRREAVGVSIEMFADPDNRRKITRFVETGKFPWEAD
ncbi:MULTISPECIES: enoyl-CoA hydratase/isomerase [Burkholderia]|uniref:Enoyl-CoA hydratase n=2 Tax=Burkholderia gladioli TaxID=28095 RepID=A0A2A7SCB7_BURGA|nr:MULTISPECIES: enoyl-CoA hydratase/isomerase [Burkholderia]AEA62700.1 polyketide biosynthesis enoyl-CoA hydratase [Burkholderia gladioli BSR3]ATF89429.1 enoyl-CoA hydratase [Burkholderia gladioli pv. gladioli]MBJ9710535.1 enoyl-CoA hydratase/isomerase [Burkholderia gladioli]MBU9158454.1 enoyl-CoA hydratase/isomerase [Burkholderia gladioli]MBU9384116.1 enoyl-CoA hydratase/isomerase [Burkholderia gladioli]